MEIVIDNITIPVLIGKNAVHNTQLVSEANDDDLWFHVTDKPSAHIIAKIANIEFDDKIFGLGR